MAFGCIKGLGLIPIGKQLLSPTQVPQHQVWTTLPSLVCSCWTKNRSNLWIVDWISGLNQ